MKEKTSKLYKDQKKTVYEISKRTGINVDKLYRLCENATKIQYADLKKIAECEEVEVDYLYKQMLQQERK